MFVQGVNRLAVLLILFFLLLYYSLFLALCKVLDLACYMRCMGYQDHIPYDEGFAERQVSRMKSSKTNYQIQIRRYRVCRCQKERRTRKASNRKTMTSKKNESVRFRVVCQSNIVHTETGDEKSDLKGCCIRPRAQTQLSRRQRATRAVKACHPKSQQS